MKAILKYPGSKWRIAQDLVQLIPEHRSYVEPFFGSGAVLFNKPISPIETINDMSDDVVNLFQCIQQDCQKLSYLIATTPFARQTYNNAYQASDDPYISACHFLIKCWQGHGFRVTGERVGWKNDVQGREKAYALRNWCDLPERITCIADRLKLVQIEKKPALDVIKKFDFENVFMYLDPPYILETRCDKRGQYKYEMTNEDHVDLLKTIVKSKAKIMISGYASALYDEYLRDWSRKEIKSNDSTGRITQEIIWTNYELQSQISLFDTEGKDVSH